MKVVLRTTKFPFFFWGFNRGYECELDFKNMHYENLESKTNYAFEKFNFYGFLALKYLPILFIFYCTFSRFDFYPSRMNIAAYVLALFLAVIVNLLEQIARKIGVVLLVIFTAILSYFIGEIFLLAYTFKYFLLFSVCIIFYIDLRFMPFSLLKGEKVVANFLLDKELARKMQ